MRRSPVLIPPSRRRTGKMASPTSGGLQPASRRSPRPRRCRGAGQRWAASATARRWEVKAQASADGTVGDHLHRSAHRLDGEGHFARAFGKPHPAPSWPTIPPASTSGWSGGTTSLPSLRSCSRGSFSCQPDGCFSSPASAPGIVVGEVHHPVAIRQISNPSWLTIPERDLYTGVAIFGAVGLADLGRKVALGPAWREGP